MDLDLLLGLALALWLGLWWLRESRRWGVRRGAAAAAASARRRRRRAPARSMSGTTTGTTAATGHKQLGALCTATRPRTRQRHWQ